MGASTAPAAGRDRMMLALMSLRDRIRSLFRLFLLFTVLVAVAMISAITTIRLTIHGHQEVMPKLEGMSLEAAQRVTRGLGLGLKVEDKLFSTQYPANNIVRQMPPPGTHLKMGQDVHVLVSLGPPKVTVPNLTGSSLRAARIAAVQRGLAIGDVAVVYWPQGEMDQVVAQDPSPETSEVRSPAVNLLVSNGQAPQAFLCPKFVGRPLSEVRRELEKKGFAVGQVTSIPTDSGQKGTILSQSPPPGSKITSDTEFTFQAAQ
jgi:beta-lactam-binding protein with PASTA domain